jgi:hypothetical protein
MREGEGGISSAVTAKSSRKSFTTTGKRHDVAGKDGSSMGHVAANWLNAMHMKLQNN